MVAVHPQSAPDRKVYSAAVPHDQSYSSSTTLVVGESTGETVKRRHEESLLNASERKPTSKAVSFDFSSLVAHSNQFSREEMDEFDLWYHKHENTENHDKTMEYAQTIYEKEKRRKSKKSCCYVEIMERAYYVCSQNPKKSRQENLTEEEKLHLRLWAEQAPERCGIEKWAIHKIHKDRSIRRKELIDTIREIQSEEFDTLEERQDYIRECCECISRPSRMMAQLLAEARAASFYKAVCQDDMKNKLLTVHGWKKKLNLSLI